LRIEMETADDRQYLSNVKIEGEDGEIAPYYVGDVRSLPQNHLQRLVVHHRLLERVVDDYIKYELIDHR